MCSLLMLLGAKTCGTATNHGQGAFIVQRGQRMNMLNSMLTLKNIVVFYVRIDKPQATSTGAIYCTTTVYTQNESDLLESPCFSFKHRKMFIEKLLMQLGASESLSHLTSQLKPSIILNACCKHEDTFERGQ